MNFADLSLLWLRLRQWLKNFSVIMFLVGLAVGAIFGSVFLWSGDNQPAHDKPSAAPISSAASARFEEANRLMEKGSCAEAIPLYQTLLRDTPSAIGVLNNLALCQSQLGQAEEARRTLEQAINAQAKTKVPHDNLTRVYAQLANLSYQKVKTGIDIRRYANEKRTDPPVAAPTLQAMHSMNGDDLTTAAKAPLPPTTLAAVKANQPPETTASANVAEQPLPLTVNAVKAELLPLPQVPAVKKPTLTPPKNPPPPKAPAIEAKHHSLKAEAKTPEPPMSKNQTTAIYRALQDWAKAWSSKNLNDYFASYSSQFRPSGGLSASDWRNDRIGKIAGKQKIAVRLTQFKFTPQASAKEMLVSFAQSYQADELKLSARKQVRMIYEGARWKILEENVN